ncbi:MAG: lysine--tRNA ligase [Deltaproteobacteria bacterium]|nr:lysine--tRNA ligase [Deltaproteobacteria bacterium]
MEKVPPKAPQNAQDAAEPVLSENSVMQIRQKKVADLRAAQTNPYRVAENPKNLAAELRERFDSFSKEELETKRNIHEAGATIKFSVAGRILLYRSFGKSTFMTIRDRSGRIQIFCQQSKLNAEAYDLVKHVDLGDIIFVEGTIFKTKTGELSIDAEKFILLTKNIRPLPEKFHGLTDVEARYRHRYVDLICNDAVKDVFVTRARIIQTIRDFFNRRNYLEVETPMLHPLVGGAAARPFKTHHNTLKMDLFMRIAPELYLKRLVVGGLDRVFEINRCFRNEGISIKHNPEFTMLEFYEAYANYHGLMTLTEELFEELALKVCGKTEITYQGQAISLKRPYRRLTVIEALKEFALPNPEDKTAVTNLLKKKGFEVDSKTPLAELQWQCFEEVVESQLIQPTYVLDHPIQISPLARRSEENPDVAQRFELYIGGRELANGFNELNDPEDQRQRFLDQVRRKAAGDQEAADYDEDYIEALQYGLPPTAGEGIGIDRLTMLLTDSPSIRDVILFPQMRPTASAAAAEPGAKS